MIGHGDLRRANPHLSPLDFLYNQVAIDLLLRQADKVGHTRSGFDRRRRAARLMCL